MNATRRLHPRRLEGLSYALADDGMELPVLDVTHPLFASSIDESRLDVLGARALAKAKDFRKLPDWYKRFLGRRSFILGGILLEENRSGYLSGMGTLMTKLGPDLIGGGWRRFIDRQASKGFGAVIHRMRLRDMCRMQAEELVPRLEESPGRKLCFLDIAAGAGSDAINTLILLREKDDALLAGRPIEIVLLDVESFGPRFAEASVRSLREPGGRLHGLDVSTRVLRYDWHDTAPLREALREREACIVIAASEGGLFYYGTDEAIRRNLETLARHRGRDLVLVGDVVREATAVHPAIPAMSALSGFSLRFLGLAGMRELLEETGWTIHRALEDNPVHVIWSARR